MDFKFGLQRMNAILRSFYFKVVLVIREICPLKDLILYYAKVFEYINLQNIIGRLFRLNIQ